MRDVTSQALLSPFFCASWGLGLGTRLRRASELPEEQHRQKNRSKRVHRRQRVAAESAEARLQVMSTTQCERKSRLNYVRKTRLSFTSNTVIIFFHLHPNPFLNCLQDLQNSNLRREQVIPIICIIVLLVCMSGIYRLLMEKGACKL